MMRFILKAGLFSLLCIISYMDGKAQDLSYFLPDSLQYDPTIPKPKDIIYHEVGEWHVTHDRLVNYMKALASAAPGRIKMEQMGLSYEGRPQVLLIITSPQNHANLEAIRQQHVKLTDPSQSSSLSIDNMPAVVYIGHSIHGNESSGSNASLVSAYYLAAAKGPQIDELLNNTVILFDPSFNPDGLQRFSTWVNQHKSKNLVSDPISREFNEVWPGGRFNHYWFDLNRDWLPAQHVESVNRLAIFHKWKPNVLTDHHEQESNATFFFQPGVASRVNPLTPAKNQELTAKLGTYHAAFLDRIGSLYFTGENYDDFYYGKGSTYPDVNGAVGILFEQGSSRGHAMQTINGTLTFPFTIRNQFTATLSTLEGVKAIRRELLQMQRDFYKGYAAEAASHSVKGIVFGDGSDHARTNMFVTMLRRHQIEVYRLASDFGNEGTEFKSSSSFVVPLSQPQHRLIRTIFDKTIEYKDSLFYDITAWTMPLAFGLPYSELNATQYSTRMLGSKVVRDSIFSFNVPQSNYAYIIPWTHYYAPAALYELLNKNVIVKTAMAPFEIETLEGRKKYGYGTLMVSVGNQEMNSKVLHDTMQSLARKYQLPVQAVFSGSVTGGSALGSRKFGAVTKPTIALITGAGVNPTDAGEVWHLMDQRFNIPMSHLEISAFNRADIVKYTTIIMVGGNYAELNKDKLKSWVQNGGTLILTEEAVSWASQQGVSGIALKKATLADSTKTLTYAQREQLEGAQQVSGAVLNAKVDITHPLAYGYTRPEASLFKANRVFMEKSRNPYASPFYYGPAPLQSGWVSRENYSSIKNSAAVIVNTSGSGRIISIADNPNFRAFWLGGSKLFMNSVFFSKLIDPASARVED